MNASYNCNYTKLLLASYPGSPAFIQLEHNKEGNKEQKMRNTLKAGEPGISSSRANVEPT